ISRTWPATRALTTRRRSTLSLRTMRGRARRPRSAIVAPTTAICSGVARSRSWPIALEPTARLSVSLLAGGGGVGLAGRTRGGAVLADRARADGEAVGQLARRRDGARLGVRHARSLVEPERLRHPHQPLGAQLGPEWREDRVARVDEGLRERAAARLAAGVAQ